MGFERTIIGNDLAIMFDEKRKIFYREGTTDIDVFDSMGKDYRDLKITPGDKILDLGAHAGYFAAWAVEQGAKEIYCFEPEKESFRVLCENAKLIKEKGCRIEVINSAVIREWNDTIDFYVNQRKGKDWNNMFPTRGRQKVTVNAVNIDNVFQLCNYDIVKSDIEAAEYSVFMDYHIPDHVKQLIMELHFHRPYWKDAAPKLIQSLKDDGFTAVREPDCSKNYWVQIGYFVRE